MFKRIVLILITSPMMSLAYVLGGVETSALFIALLALLTAAVQVSTAAIACSSLLKTTLEAFWGTYLLLIAFAVGPAMLYMLELLPDFQLVSGIGIGSDQAAGLFVLFIPVALDGLEEGRSSFWNMLAAIVPVWTVAGMLLVASGVAVTKYRDVAPINTKHVGQFVHAIWLLLTLPVRWIRRRLAMNRRGIATDVEVPQAGQARTMPRALPLDKPVAWRERQATALTRWKPWLIAVPLILLLEWWWLERVLSHPSDAEVVTVLIDLGAFVAALLMVTGLTCKTFASEREHQTLDLLLTTPLNNRELLTQKLDAVQRVIWMATLALGILGLMRLWFGENRYDLVSVSIGSEWNMSALGVRHWDWWLYAARYLVGLIAHAWLYMTLVKWIAVWFSLRFNTLMKAIFGTVITVALLCTAFAALTAIPMLMTNVTPREFPVWFFTSPVTILVFNKVHDLREVFNNTRFYGTDVVVLIINFAVYGAVAAGVRAFALRQLPRRLNRRDGYSVTGV